MYPMHDMIRGKVFPAPRPDPNLFAFPPTLSLVSRNPHGRVPTGQGEGARCKPGEIERLDLQLKLPQPGVGVLNVTGNIQGWSFSDPMPKSYTKVCCYVTLNKCSCVGSCEWLVPVICHTSEIQ